jgi:predicted cobalt transporter CbtA
MATAPLIETVALAVRDLLCALEVIVSGTGRGGLGVRKTLPCLLMAALLLPACAVPQQPQAPSPQGAAETAETRLGRLLAVTSSPAGTSNSVLWIVDRDRGAVTRCFGGTTGSTVCTPAVTIP